MTLSELTLMNLSRPNLPPGEYYFSGNEAAAEAAIDAGCRFYAGYPITPSSEIMECMADKLPDVDGIFIQMEDEIASICSVIGAVWAGAKAMTATSGPGFSLMQEALGYAAFTETPLVIMDIQRAGPCTGQATRTASGDHMQAKWGSHGDYQVISYCPWSVQEMYDCSIRAFNLAERYRVPVIVSAEEAIGHLRERITIPDEIRQENRPKQKGVAPFDTDAIDGVPPMPAFGEGENLMITGSTHDGMGFRKTEDPKVHQKLVERINLKILNHADHIIETESMHTEDAELLIVAYGFTARSSAFAVAQLRKEGFKVGLLRLKTIWPFAERVLRGISGVRKILVPEMNLGQIAGEVKKVFAKDVIPLNLVNGDVIQPRTIIEKVREVYR
ncbi:MAG: 2-oxoacid:acceptor oxidoreductase subunit alpha [Proteobacteria bacterium]|nr:2-oxoacid:acceptor oxidoreductase subunit alpha [Pseudomonadota bacterium]